MNRPVVNIGQKLSLEGAEARIQMLAFEVTGLRSKLRLCCQKNRKEWIHRRAG
jgi:hypothetical protein